MNIQGTSELLWTGKTDYTESKYMSLTTISTFDQSLEFKVQSETTLKS